MSSRGSRSLARSWSGSPAAEEALVSGEREWIQVIHPWFALSRHPRQPSSGPPSSPLSVVLVGVRGDEASSRLIFPGLGWAPLALRVWPRQGTQNMYTIQCMGSDGKQSPCCHVSDVSPSSTSKVGLSSSIVFGDSKFSSRLRTEASPASAFRNLGSFLMNSKTAPCSSSVRSDSIILHCSALYAGLSAAAPSPSSNCSGNSLKTDLKRR